MFRAFLTPGHDVDGERLTWSGHTVVNACRVWSSLRGSRGQDGKVSLTKLVNDCVETKLQVAPYASAEPGSRSLFSSSALTATNTLDPDIDSAAISGRSTSPNAG